MPLTLTFSPSSRKRRKSCCPAQRPMREWVSHPQERGPRGQVLRALHTLKGSARLAGALRLGEMAHRTESAIETIGIDGIESRDIEPLLDHLDELELAFKRLQVGAVGAEGDAGAAAPSVASIVNQPAAIAEAAEPPAGESVGPSEVSARPAPVLGGVAWPAAVPGVCARRRRTIRSGSQPAAGSLGGTGRRTHEFAGPAGNRGGSTA